MVENETEEEKLYELTDSGNPSRTFHNFKASKSVDSPIVFDPKTSVDERS